VVREKAAKHNISLFAMPMEDLRHFVADERKIRQVFYNLLSNAVKFTPDGGTVTVKSVADATGTVTVSVTDTGIGIESEKLSRVFNSFEQLKNPGEQRYEGTGLGLSLSRRLVELHGGKIFARSDGIEKGSTFTFSIPPLTIPEGKKQPR
jgi:signal transduction histidine kinase